MYAEWHYLEQGIEALGRLPRLQLLCARLHLRHVRRRRRAQDMVEDALGERVGLTSHLDCGKLNLHC